MGPEAGCGLLLVDDNALARERLRSLFEACGHPTSVAQSGEEALRLLRARPDLRIMVVDWIMPGLDGLEVARQARQLRREGYLFILVLSARMGDEHRRLALQAGADAFLGKHAGPEEIRDQLRAALRVIRLEERLAAQLDELQAARARAEAARVQAESANKAKSEFLAMVNHELRTPLQGVIGLVRLLERPQPGTSSQDLLNLLSVSADALLGVVSEVLDFSSIEAGSFQLEEKPFRLRDLAEGALAPVAALAAARGLALTLDLPEDEGLLVVGDPLRLRQVLINLLGNAVKFSSQGEVRLTLAADPGPRARTVTVRFSVQDQGPGVPEAEREQIFGSFERGTARGGGGLGLGLAISARLVEAMGSKLAVGDAPLGGADFHFTLTLPVSAPPEDEDAGSEWPGPQAPLRILLAEDNPINRIVTALLLERLGHTVLTAGNGLEALETAEEAPELVLLDLELPDMDGWDLCRALRERERHSGRAPSFIVALTGRATPEDRIRSLAAGMDGFLSKPLRPGDLEHAVEAAREGRRRVPDGEGLH